VQRTRPEGACSGHTLPVARIGACVKRRFREISSCQGIMISRFAGMQTRLSRRVFAYGFRVSQPRGKRDGTRRIARTLRALLNLHMPASLRPRDSEKALSTRNPVKPLPSLLAGRNLLFRPARSKAPGDVQCVD